MANQTSRESLEVVRNAQTEAPNFNLDTEQIVARLKEWQAICTLRVVGADVDSVDIEFDTLPKDMDDFVEELCDFCPDVVDHGIASIRDMIEEMGEAPADIQQLIEGLDLEDEESGLEILKREIKLKKRVTLWWD